MSDLSYFIACEGGCGRKVVVPANAAQDRTVSFDIPADWLQGRTSFGGLISTLAVQAMRDELNRLLDLADRFGASATVVPLLRQAALAGDVEAMRRLAEDFEPDPVEAWTWVHLADLCGTDLTRIEAVYEDGSPADDDIPGNIFAVGVCVAMPISTFSWR